MIATQEHRDGFRFRLAALGVDVAQAVRSGQLTMLHAGRTLKKFTVNGMPDPTGGQADIAMKIISLGVAEACCHGFSLTRDQPVEGAARGQVQGVADVEQPLVRFPDADVRPVGQPAGSERPQHRHIAEPPSGLLELGLEQVGGVTERREALVK